MLQQFYKAATGQALTGAFDTEQLMGKQIVVEMGDQVKQGINKLKGLFGR